MKGDGRNRLQILLPLTLREIYRMIPHSAKSILMEVPLRDHLTRLDLPRSGMVEKILVGTRGAGL
jgi:hypothetical protein